MTIYHSYKDEADSLIKAGAFFHRRNWAPATSGNYSLRISIDEFLMTVSGAHKGELRPQDFLVVNSVGEVVEAPNPGDRPSAETGLHTQLYSLDSECGAVLHSHSVLSTVVSRNTEGNEIVFSGYEMQKAFRGVGTHEGEVRIPVFENDQDIQRLASEVATDVARNGLPVGYLIRGHGLYSWAEDVFGARRQIEALEFLMECEWMERRIR